VIEVAPGNGQPGQDDLIHDAGAWYQVDSAAPPLPYFPSMPSGARHDIGLLMAWGEAVDG